MDEQQSEERAFYLFYLRVQLNYSNWDISRTRENEEEKLEIAFPFLNASSFFCKEKKNEAISQIYSCSNFSKSYIILETDEGKWRRSRLNDTDGIFMR